MMMCREKNLMNTDQRERFSRQILFAGIGEAGQRKLLDSAVVLVGCGALGTAAANLLVRAGVGRLRIIDRDFVEVSNLQRQTLFEESDAEQKLPKAVAAEKRLRGIDSQCSIEGAVADLTPANALELLGGFQVILDGTDNFETRLLMNDAAIQLGIPWIYAAAVGSAGVTMTIVPGETACLACLLGGGGGEGGGVEETCDTVGILNTAATAIAAVQVTEAIQILIGVEATGGPLNSGRPNSGRLKGRLTSIDVWKGEYRSIQVARNPDCVACGRRESRYLKGEAQPHVTMCGRDSVQVHERKRKLELSELGKRLKAAGMPAASNAFLLQFQVNSYQVTVFEDGRAIFKGTRDPAVARSLYARYIGS
jgi:molybdopterin-synthase adenylyltransferase